MSKISSATIEALRKKAEEKVRAGGSTATPAAPDLSASPAPLKAAVTEWPDVLKQERRLAQAAGLSPQDAAVPHGPEQEGHDVR